MLFTTPLSASRPIQAITRNRKLVQNGSTTSSSSRLRRRSGARAIA